MNGSQRDERMEESAEDACPICYERLTEDRRQLETCGHVFCSDCLQDYCRHAASSHSQFPLNCPDIECQTPISSRLLQQLLNETDYTNLQQAIANWKDRQRLHPPRNNNNTTSLDRKTRRLLQKYTKPCSHCGALIEKESGCDHIVCLQCHQDMCFKCGTHQHLQGQGAIRTCQQCRQSYLDHRRYCLYRLQLALFCPIYLPLALLYTLGMIVLSILTCAFGCAPCRRQDSTTCKSLTVLTCFPALAIAQECGFHCCDEELREASGAPGLPGHATSPEWESEDSTSEPDRDMELGTAATPPMDRGNDTNGRQRIKDNLSV